MRYELDDRHIATWQQRVCDEMLDADAPIHAGQSLGVHLGVTGLAGGVVHLDMSTRHPGLSIGRSPARVARDAGYEIMGLSYVTSGEASIDTGAREHIVRAGELCLLSSRQPFMKRLSGSYKEEFLYLPSPVARALGRTFPTTSQRVLVAPARGLGGLLADSILAMSRARHELTAEDWQIALGAVFELASGVFGRAEPERLGLAARDVQRDRVLRFIEAQLHDPDLSPPRIAAALGMSCRYLHLVFEDSETSAAQTILVRRLERCRAALLDPAQRHRTVSEIAFGLGFNDAAHFSRTFKARFGVSPRSVRAPSTRAEPTAKTPRPPS